MDNLNNEYYKMNIKEIYSKFNTSEKGLSKKQVKENLKKYGKNILQEKKQKNAISVFFSQFKDLLVIILVISAIISIFINEVESTIVIFLVLTINASLGTYQFFKAEKSIEGLKKLSTSKSIVKRDNKIIKIDSRELVVGDIVFVESGDLISCDGRIIEAYDLEVNESALTGESIEVEKNNYLVHKENPNLGEISNMLFSGTFCVKGKGTFVVCKVGMQTELGKIATIIKETKENKTPLQESLDKFSKILASIIILICILVFILGVYRHNSFFDSLMFAVSLAVAAIPEALSTIVVIVLAIGMEKMSKENVIMKELNAVEGLGSISVIASDKTGTITEEFMEVKDTFSYVDELTLKQYLLYSMNNSNNPTELALRKYIKRINENKISGILVKEIPFNSSKKMASNIYLIDGRKLLFTKGACEKVLENCKYILKKSFSRNENNLLTAEEKEKIIKNIHSFTSKGFRVIAIAYKNLNNNVNVEEVLEEDLIFVGIIALYNPVRKEVYDAIKDCKRANIKTIMLTGDYVETAKYIAKDTNILSSEDNVLSGDEINKLSEEELKERIKNVEVCARLDPIHKIRIVKALQENGEIVAMTGDGINDAPSLKQADVGIAMGNGTEVAKDVSSIILADNNFSTIVKAVSNGRIVYLNIQNSIVFLLSGNIAAILMVLYTCFFMLPVPFASVHLLFINLLTDSLPAIAIGVENSPREVLNDKPRKRNEHFLNKKISIVVIFEGFLIALCSMLAYNYGLKSGIACARTMTFLTLCLARLLHGFNCSCEDSIIRRIIRFKKINWCLVLSFLIGFVLINAIILIPDFAEILQASPLDSKQVMYMYVFSFIPFIIIQSGKILKQIMKKGLFNKKRSFIKNETSKARL